jgi:transposase
MRLPASEKLQIISLVEQSHLPARRTLQMLGIKPSTFYRWYDRFRSGGPEALEDKPSKPDRVWNRIPDDIRQRVVMMAFEQPELSPRELATRFTDTNRYYVSESSVYRLLIAGRRCAAVEGPQPGWRKPSSSEPHIAIARQAVHRRDRPEIRTSARAFSFKR